MWCVNPLVHDRVEDAERGGGGKAAREGCSSGDGGLVGREGCDERFDLLDARVGATAGGLWGWGDPREEREEGRGTNKV